jgi:hypothetical protein
MEFLTFAGAVALLFGVLSLMSREMLISLGNALNRPIVTIDDRLRSIRVPLGVLLLVVGVWNIMIAFGYPQLWYLHLIGIFILFFGLLYLFVPEWLTVISQFLDQILLSTDELFIGTRKTIGVILLLAAVYIFYSVYLIVM